MNTKKELQDLHNKLDKSNRTLAKAKERGDQAVVFQFETQITELNKAIAVAKAKNNVNISDKGSRIKALAFNRELTKAEQADMGKLKKSVRGLAVVHPLSALGRELAVEKVTGFAPQEF